MIDNEDIADYELWDESDWEEFAEGIKDKVEEALDEWCWDISGDTAIECYANHSDMGLYELAEEFEGMKGIDDEDIELIQEMPEGIYKEVSNEIQKDVEGVINEICKDIKNGKNVGIDIDEDTYRFCEGE